MLKMTKITLKQSYLNIFFAVTERIIQLAFSVLSIIFVTKSLTIEHYASYSYALNLAQLSAVITILVANDYIVKAFLNWNTSNAEHLFIQFFVLRVLLIILFYVAALSFILFFNPILLNQSLVALIIIFALVMLIEETFGVYLNYYIARGNQKTITRVRLVSGFIKVALIVMLFKVNINNVVYFAFASLIASVVFGVQIFINYQRENNSFVIFNYSELKSLVIKGIHFSVGASLILLLIKIDRQIAHHTLNEYEFGSYSLAMQFVEQWLGLSVVAASLIAPRFFFNQPKDEAFNNCIKFVLIFIGCSVVGTLIMRQLIIPMLWPFLSKSVTYNVHYFNTLIWISIPFFANQIVYYYQLYADKLKTHYIIYGQALLFLFINVFYLKNNLDQAVLFTNLNILICNIFYLTYKHTTLR